MPVIAVRVRTPARMARVEINDTRTVADLKAEVRIVVSYGRLATAFFRW